MPTVPPTITGGDDGPNERKVVVNKPLTLKCEARGHPPPSLTWLKDGVPVRNGESVSVLEQGSKIEILSATVSDSGRYVCVATSIAGEKQVKYDVRVLGNETHKNMPKVYCELSNGRRTQPGPVKDQILKSFSSNHNLNS